MNKSIASILIGLAIGIILIVLWLFTFDFSHFAETLRHLKLSYVALAGMFYLFAYFIRSVRWNLLLRKQTKLSIKDTWLISAAGNWLNYLVPIRAGEVVKAVLVRKLKSVSAVSVMPSIFIDKFFDTLGIFFVLLLIPFVRISASKGLNILIILLILMFVIIFGILILAVTHKSRITSILQILFRWLPVKFRSKINHLIVLFIDGLNIFEHRRRVILYSIGLTSLGVLFDGMYFYLMFIAFNQNPGFLIVLFGYTLINLSYVLPQPPAQLGSNEWMMIIIFSLGFGLTRNIASAIMVFAHLFTACIISVLGILGFSYAGIKSVTQIKGEL
ncbi:MAG: lysylphosphatidylglycerol synthase transmembrane domain-containing protein [Candidatus Cloacimonadaceae bacterium]